MKVLHVITGLKAGGAETQLRSLIAHSRHDSTVVCLYNAGSVADGLRSDGVEVIDLQMRGNRDLRALRTLTRLMREGRYDVVHTHLYRACLYGRIAARLARVPRIIATEHSLVPGSIEGRPTTRAVRELYRLAERLGDTTIAVSRAVEGELRAWGVRPDRMVLIQNGIELETFAFQPELRRSARHELGIPEGQRVIGGLGRLHPDKQFDLLIDAAAPLLDERTSLLIVGEGTERAALEERVAALGVDAHVLLPGERPAGEVLHAMDVLVAPSSAETFGLAALEGLANGLPVAYVLCPPLQELGVPVAGAMQVQPDPESIRAAVVAGLARPAHDRVRPDHLAGFDMTGVAAQVDDLYLALPARRTR